MNPTFNITTSTGRRLVADVNDVKAFFTEMHWTDVVAVTALQVAQTYVDADGDTWERVE